MKMCNEVAAHRLAGFMVVAALITLAGQGRPRPPDLLMSPPDGAIILFDGTDFSQWTDQSGGPVDWKIVDGAMEVVPKTREDFEGEWPKKRGIQTRQPFRDFRLHVEFKVPSGEQDNSGVYLQRRYEIQIVNSYDSRPHGNQCGAIYKVKQPDVNASRPACEWQSFDITFHAAQFDQEGEHLRKIANARMTVVHNGVPIQKNVEIPAKTGQGDPEGPEPGPIMLQDHGGSHQFRNVWVLPL